MAQSCMSACAFLSSASVLMLMGDSVVVHSVFSALLGTAFLQCCTPVCSVVINGTAIR